MKTPRKGDCGGKPRVGSKGDPKPRRGNGRGATGGGNHNGYYKHNAQTS